MGQKPLNAFIYAQKQAIVVFNTSRGGFMGNDNLKTDSKLPWWKVVIGILVALLIMVAAQLFSQFAAIPADLLKLPVVVAIVCQAVAYVVLAFLGQKLLIEKFFKIPIDSIRIKKPGIKMICIITAVLLPAIVIAIYMMMPGEWTTLTLSNGEKIRIVVGALIFQSIAAGIVEELTFRGVIFGLLEKKTNTVAAAVIPSVIFGMIHFSKGMSLVSFIQLVIAGTFVGVMFSSICAYTDNFWNNALVHACWNATTFGIMHIDTAPSGEALYTYVLKTKSMLITGGDFGIESSIIAIMAYAVVIVVYVLFIRKKKRDVAKN